MSRPLLALLLFTALPASSQQRRELTTADYARAESMLAYNTNPLVLHGGVRPAWMNAASFWYRNTTESGSEFLVVNASDGGRVPAFDHVRVAAALSAATGGKYDGGRLPFTVIRLSEDRQWVRFNAAGGAWRCDVGGAGCSREGAAPAAANRNEIPSPDGKRVAFLRDYNLWTRDAVTGAESQLTRDGVKDFGYATDNAGWTKSDRPILVWSPDSTKIATFQQDQRGVGEMHMVETQVGRPILHTWKYPFVGDTVVLTIQRVMVDVAAKKVIRLQMPPDQHRSTYCDDLACNGVWGDVQWNPDSTDLAFASVSRDHKYVQVRVANAATGAVRDVFDERVATYFGFPFYRMNWRYLPASHEVIWHSERDDWGHLYLYDADSGKLKNRITTGPGNVLSVVRVDERERVVYFVAAGKEKGRDPYFNHLYRAGFDGRDQTLLTPEDANHEVDLSPGGGWFVDRYSKPDVPPVSVLRDSAGRIVATLERADVKRLSAAGWTPPIPIVVKARDRATDLYGLLYRPARFNPAAKYPIVNHIYPAGIVGNRSFAPSRSDSQALAELGFVVVEIDGTGTPGRSRSFLDMSYGDISDGTLPDQVAAMKELARRYPWIDLDRAGIHGHSGGGYATARAMFLYPEFFKVGVSQAGDHDNRGYEDDWPEGQQGLLVRKPDGSTNYDGQANQALAKNLKGKLLLAHGTMDANVPFHQTLLVVSELIRANKDFDLILLPNRGHGFGSEPYMMRRRWDYFVRHLLGADPPAGYELRPPGAAGRP